MFAYFDLVFFLTFFLFFLGRARKSMMLGRIGRWEGVVKLFFGFTNTEGRLFLMMKAWP